MMQQKIIPQTVETVWGEVKVTVLSRVIKIGVSNIKMLAQSA